MGEPSQHNLQNLRASVDQINTFPLFNQLFSDPNLKFCFRGVDLNWKYNDIFPQLQCGFNPFSSTVFFSNKSAFSDWFFSKHRDMSYFITGDFVVNELLFGIHDYLHIWTYHCINDLTNGRLNHLISKNTPLTPEEIDEVVFIHLASEAVATVGLDYWFVSRNELWKVLSVGTFITRLTTSFHENHMDEFKKFNPDFNPFRPGFLKEMTKFYCSGELHGFDLESLQRSNIVFRWLRHEIGYGQTQRDYSKVWIKYLFSDCPRYGLEDNFTPSITIPAAYDKVLDTLGEMLWEKVTGQKEHYIKGNLEGGTKPKFRTEFDPKYSNPLAPNYHIDDNKELNRFELMFLAANKELHIQDTSKLILLIKILKNLANDNKVTKAQIDFLLRDNPTIPILGDEPEAIFVLP